MLALHGLLVERQLNQLIESQATAASTKTLTAASSPMHRFTGTTADQIVVLPDATTLLAGGGYTIWNESTQIITVNANGGGLISTVLPGERGRFDLITATPAAGVWSFNRFMTVAEHLILSRLRTGFLQYINSAQTTNSTTTMADITLDTDVNSFANSFFTKSSSTEFRTDFAGRVKISYSVGIGQAGNNRGGRAQVVRNGTLVTGTLKTSIGATTTQYGTVTHSQIVECAVNDLFKLQFAATVGGQVNTVAANNALMLAEIYSLGLT